MQKIDDRISGRDWSKHRLDTKDARVMQSDTAPLSQSTSATHVLRLLNLSLLLNVVGFGTCSLLGLMSVGEILLYILTSAMYLIAGLMALLCFVRAHKAFNELWKMCIVMLIALVSGGWGFFWGIVGVAELFGIA